MHFWLFYPENYRNAAKYNCVRITQKCFFACLCRFYLPSLLHFYFLLYRLCHHQYSPNIQFWYLYQVVYWDEDTLVFLRQKKSFPSPLGDSDYQQSPYWEAMANSRANYRYYSSTFAQDTLPWNWSLLELIIW